MGFIYMAVCTYTQLLLQRADTNPRTKIAFSLPERSKVKLVIYDILGKQVAVLVDDVKEAGHYRVEFDGSRVASGMYLYVLKAGYRVISRKMLLTK